tara:strand:- start:792 stop:1085 length:294 start_codon:yes stop_codon:yes gene_type:complete
MAKKETKTKAKSAASKEAKTEKKKKGPVKTSTKKEAPAKAKAKKEEVTDAEFLGAIGTRLTKIKFGNRVYDLKLKSYKGREYKYVGANGKLVVAIIK